MPGSVTDACRRRCLSLVKKVVHSEHGWPPDKDALHRRLGNSGEDFSVVSKEKPGRSEVSCVTLYGFLSDMKKAFQEAAVQLDDRVKVYELFRYDIRVN